ncbi:hypothetical protein ACSTJ6_23510, partial [Vibrio parahaemolyticus]
VDTLRDTREVHPRSGGVLEERDRDGAHRRALRDDGDQSGGTPGTGRDGARTAGAREEATHTPGAMGLGTSGGAREIVWGVRVRPLV